MNLGSAEVEFLCARVASSPLSSSPGSCRIAPSLLQSLRYFAGFSMIERRRCRSRHGGRGIPATMTSSIHAIFVAPGFDVGLLFSREFELAF